MGPKRRRLVKAAAKKQPADTQRRLDMDEHEESPRSKRLKGRAGDAPSLVQVPFLSPSNSRDLSRDQSEYEEGNRSGGDGQRGSGSGSAEEVETSTPTQNEGDEEEEELVPTLQRCTMKSREQRGSAEGGETSTPTQSRENEEQEEVPTLQRRTRKSTAGLSPAEQRPSTVCAVEDGEGEHAMEMQVVLSDEVAPIIKTDMPDMVLPTWLDTHAAFTTKKITIRSSISGKMAEFRKCLKDLKLEDRFRKSCFGHFLKMPKGLFAPKLVHNVLLRRVICEKKHELWFNFHGLPLRFSLLEFALMTKLRCSEFPSTEYLEDVREKGKELWDLVTGKDKKKAASSDHIMTLIKSDKIKNKNVKFSLCLAWFVHGVLCAKDTRCGVEEDVVCLASRPEEFNKFPWGRKSFELTMAYLGKDFATLGNPENSYNLYGFPWAFMAWVLEAIPAARLRQYPEQKTVPRMHRWLSDKVERDPEQVFQRVETPEVHPYLVPTPVELRDVLDGFVSYQDVEDALVDGLMQQMKGVTMLRKENAEPNTPMEHVVLSRGSMLNVYSGGGAVDLLGDVGREYSGSAGDLFGYAKRREDTRAAVVRREVGRIEGVRREEGGRGGTVRRGEGGREAVGNATGECSCKCSQCKKEKKLLMDKVDAIEKVLVEVRDSTKNQVPAKRVVFPGRALKSPFTSGRKRGKKVMKKVDMYKVVGKKRREALDAFLEEKKEEKTPLCLGHEYNYKDLEGVMSMQTKLEDQHVDDILSMMRVRIKTYSQHYVKSDVLLDLEFLRKMCEMYKFEKATAVALAAPMDIQLTTIHFKEELMEYAEGKRPNPGARKWAGSKRIMSVYKLEEDHYVTLELQVEEAKILVYDSNYGDNSDDAFAALIQPITCMVPIYIKQCGMFQNLPEEILNKNPWSYERVTDLPAAQTRTASAGYALAFIEHLLTKTPWDSLNEDNMVSLRLKWAVDMFHGKMVP